MIEKISPAKKAMSVFVFHEIEKRKKQVPSSWFKERRLSYISCILALNMWWHRPRKCLRVLYCIILTSAWIGLVLNTIFFNVLSCRGSVLVLCMEVLWILLLRLQCDCVVYRAGFLISHVKKAKRGSAIAVTGSSKIVAISGSFANQLTRNETAYAWVLLTLDRTIPGGVHPYISHIPK